MAPVENQVGHNDGCKDRDVGQAEAEVREAKAEIHHAVADLERGEHDLERAEQALREAEEHGHHLVEVTVDRRVDRIKPGAYVVSALKEAVHVAADRELDILREGTLHPLGDNGTIEIEGGEVFVSHVRTGGSA